MTSPFTRRRLPALGAGLAAGALAGRANAAEQTADQMLEELIQENQDSSIDSGFDNSSRTVRLPKKTLPTLSPSTAQTTEASISQYEAIVAKGGWPEVPAIAQGRCQLCASASRPRATSISTAAIRRCSIPMSMPPSAASRCVTDCIPTASYATPRCAH